MAFNACYVIIYTISSTQQRALIYAKRSSATISTMMSSKVIIILRCKIAGLKIFEKAEISSSLNSKGFYNKLTK